MRRFVLPVREWVLIVERRPDRVLVATPALLVLGFLLMGSDTQVPVSVAGKHVSPFYCSVNGGTASAVCQAAPGAGLRLYVTSVYLQTTIVQSIAMVSGTGTVCATGQVSIVADTGSTLGPPATAIFPDPIPLATNSALCITNAGIGVYNGTVTGFIAP